MQEETNSILYQQTQNGWSKKSIYTLQLLLKHMKQITKCHVFQIYAVVEKVENLEVGWRVCVYLCDVPRCSAGSPPGLSGRFGHVSV